MRQRALDGVERAAKVAREDGVSHLEGELLDGAVGETDVGGVVDQDVELAVFGCGVVDEGLDGIEVREVEISGSSRCRRRP